MSRRDQSPAGVPCFVDTLTPDLDVAKRFYGGLFGWEFARPGAMPGDPPGEYFVAQLRGHDVAGISTEPAGNGTSPPPAWNTHVAVRDANESAVRAMEAGGAVLVEPFDAPPAGRLAVLADPAGAAICVWEPGIRQGAALVNEPSAWAMSLLSTNDSEGAKDFYGHLFGWHADKFEAGPGVEVWLWRLPGYVGGEPQQPVPRDVVAAMIAIDASGSAPPNWGADADAAAAVAPELGGSVVAPPLDVAGFRRTVLADPHGAVFSVSQLQLPA